MLRGNTAGFKVPALQADAVLSQANPVSGTKYTVLEAKNARIISINANVTWTVQPTPLEVHVTIDGQTLRWHLTNPVSATSYHPYWEAGRDELNGQLAIVGVEHYHLGFLVEGRNIKVEVETTGGTTSALDARVKWEKW